MNNRGKSPAAVSAIARVLAGALMLAATSAYAQSANANPNANPNANANPNGNNPTSANASSARATPLSGAFNFDVDGAAENVNCSGDLQIKTKAVTDPSLPPGIVLFVDPTALACAGAGTQGKYVADSAFTLTRLLAPADAVETTLAFHKDNPNGFAKAKTAVLTLNLTYDTATGALTGATATLGNWVAP